MANKQRTHTADDDQDSQDSQMTSMSRQEQSRIQSEASSFESATCGKSRLLLEPATAITSITASCRCTAVPENS